MSEAVARTAVVEQGVSIKSACLQRLGSLFTWVQSGIALHLDSTRAPTQCVSSNKRRRPLRLQRGNARVLSCGLQVPERNQAKLANLGAKEEHLAGWTDDGLPHANGVPRWRGWSLRHGEAQE